MKASDSTFSDHNTISSEDRDFDEFYENRRIFGEMIEELAFFVGAEGVCKHLNSKMQAVLQKGETRDYEHLIDLESILWCISKALKALP